MGFLFWAAIGLLSGLTTSILFIRMDKSFWDKVTTWGPNVGLVGTSAYIEIAKNEESYQKVFEYFVAQSGGWLLTFFFVLYVFCKSSKRYNVTIGDIISGRHLKIIDLENERSKHSQNKISLFDYQKKLDREKSKLQKDREAIAQQIEGKICLNLISEEKVPLCLEHTNQCPNFARRLAETLPFIKEAALDSVNDLNKSLKKSMSTEEKSISIIETTRALLQLVSIYFNKYLIKEEGCRVHFRVQGEGQTYKKFVATIGSNPRDYRDELKIIPYKDSMIEKSFTSRAPALKSLNTSYHVDGNNDARWPDYITISFDELTINKLPLVSMGISFPHEDAFVGLGHYLCQVRIDWILKDLLKDYFDLINEQEEKIKFVAIQKMIAA